MGSGISATFSISGIISAIVRQAAEGAGLNHRGSGRYERRGGLESATIRRMASGQRPSWLLIITCGSRWWASVRHDARCAGRNPEERPSYAASGHQGPGHQRRYAVFRGGARVALRDWFVGRNQVAMSTFLLLRLSQLPSQFPAGRLRPLVRLSHRAAASSPPIPSRRWFPQKANLPLPNQRVGLGHRPVSAPLSHQLNSSCCSPLFVRLGGAGQR